LMESTADHYLWDAPSLYHTQAWRSCQVGL